MVIYSSDVKYIKIVIILPLFLNYKKQILLGIWFMKKKMFCIIKNFVKTII